MDTILALILSCSLHYDDALVTAYIKRASDGNPLFVVDVPTFTAHDHVQTLQEALALVADIEKQGGRPAVGVMAVPVTWAARYGRSVSDLFDACVNISVGTDAMAEFASDCAKNRAPAVARANPKAPAHRRRRLTLAAERVCILRRFDAEFHVQGFPQAILGQMAQLAAAPSDTSADSPPARSPAFPDNTNDADIHEASDWSNPRLFFSSPPARPAPVSPANATAAPTTAGSTPAPSAPSWPSPVRR